METKWTPCSERMPEKAGNYLVCIAGWSVASVAICYQDGPGKPFKWESSFNPKPTYWMPLPAPVKAGESQ